MNEELKQKANDLLIKLINGLDEGASMVMPELPELLEQLLLWRMFEHSIDALTLLIIAGGCVWFVFEMFKIKSEGVDEDTLKGIGIILFGIASAALSAFGFSQLLQVAKILIAPKLYLIQYAAEVLK